MRHLLLHLRPRQCRVLQLLWPDCALSRRELHRGLGVHPNLIGQDVAELIRLGIVAEESTKSSGRGRPGVPIRIDARRRHILGLAIGPGHIEVGRINLLGEPIDRPRRRAISRPGLLTRQAGLLLAGEKNRLTLMVGLSITGLVDPAARTLLLSSAAPRAGSASLDPIYAAARGKPVVLKNDMQALAAHWLLHAGESAGEDVLLLKLEDGQIGAAMLIDGRPNRGCAMAANELGHMRFPLPTPRCYCGQEGCIERIFSSEYLAMGGVNGKHRLAELLLQLPDSPLARRIEDRLAQAIANIVNFIRPHRLILTGSFSANDRFFTGQSQRISGQLLAGLSDRVRIARWQPQPAEESRIAAWGALADLLHGPAPSGISAPS